MNSQRRVNSVTRFSLNMIRLDIALKRKKNSRSRSVLAEEKVKGIVTSSLSSNTVLLFALRVRPTALHGVGGNTGIWAEGWIPYPEKRSSAYLPSSPPYPSSISSNSARYDTEIPQIPSALLSRNGGAYSIAHTAAVLEFLTRNLLVPSKSLIIPRATMLVVLVAACLQPVTFWRSLSDGPQHQCLLYCR